MRPQTAVNVLGSAVLAVILGWGVLSWGLRDDKAGASMDGVGTSTVVFLGDSLTEGLALARTEAYPALIAERLQAAKLPFRVVNAGVSGDTAADGLARSSAVLNSEVALLMVAFGANDLPRGVPAQECRKNMQEIIDRARAASPGVKIVVSGVDLPQHRGLAGWAEYQEMYRDLAEQNNALLIVNLLEGVAGRPDLNFPDLLHPNAQGHEIMAGKIWEALQPLLVPAPRVAAHETAR
ncbi:MAG: arylesterase [Deltaproteobacteria bacterium]|nr:arylesterase [Deltaproteobacteria bacterium]